MKLEPPADATDLKGSLSSELDKIWAQIRRGVFDEDVTSIGYPFKMVLSSWFSAAFIYYFVYIYKAPADLASFCKNADDCISSFYDCCIYYVFIAPHCRKNS